MATNDDVKTIKILDTKYEIVEDNDYCEKSNADGLCNYYNKKIYIRPVDNMFSDDVDITCKINRYNEVLKHEIIHAFLDESGLDAYSKNEELVTFLAMQFNKLRDIFEKVFE